MREIPEKYTENLTGIKPDRPYLINHGLRSADVIWNLRDLASGGVVRQDRDPVDATDEGPDSFTLTFPDSLNGANLRIVVIG